MFVVAAAIAAAAFVLSWILPQKTLRETVAAGNGIGESFAIPKHTDSFAEASRALSQLLGRDERRKLVERLAERAGVDLSAAASWLIVRLHENPAADIPALCEEFDIPVEVGEQALQELVSAGYVNVAELSAGTPEYLVTAPGEEVVERLVAERKASLERRCEGWSPENNPELNELLLQLARDLAREPSHDVAAPPVAQPASS